MSLRTIVLFALLALQSLAGPARAADYPARPIKLIVPYAPGGGADGVARIVAKQVSETIGQPIVIENKGGAGSIVGTDLVAKAEPDGYTLLLGQSGPISINPAVYKSLPYDPVKDFAPITMTTAYPYMLVVNAELPAKTLAEFVALAKAKPGALSYASAGTGTLAHLAGELFKYKAGIDVTHIPYRGTAQSTMDLLQGRIDLSVSTIPPTLTHIREGKVRALAVLSDARSDMLAEIPTVREAGFPGCEAELWTAFVVPARTPADIVGRLSQVLHDVLKSADVAQALKIQGVDPYAGTSPSVSAVIAADIVKWREVVTAAKIQNQ